jgi:phage portal protein BeeE
VAWWSRRKERLPARVEQRYGIDPWISDYLIPASWQSFLYSGQQYPLSGLNQTLAGNRAVEVSQTLPGYSAALRRCPPAFAAQMVRALVLSQARFTFRARPYGPATTSRRLFGTNELLTLEQPWPNGTSGELISRMEWHAGLAGNSYVTNYTQTGRLRVLRPDWVQILYGSQREPDDPALALDGEVVSYIYTNRGYGQGYTPEFLPPSSVAHWSPIPDPEAAGLGMSWITPAVREIMGDGLMTDHKLKFFESGATPNLVVRGLQAQDQTEFNRLVDMMENSHAGIRNAYKTLYLTAGADATVVGANLQQIDFKATQGSGETRISMLSRVHPVILGASEGLAGSSLNAGNFGMARRIWGDTWIYPTLQDLCRALAPLVQVPSNSELWFDVVDMPVLREDAKDAAEIIQIKAVTIEGLVKEGFTPKSAMAAVEGQNMNLLEHTGLVSVQLQPPGTIIPGPSSDQSAAPPPGQESNPPNGKQPNGRAPAPTANGSPARALRYSEDQPRDDHGKWSSDGGGESSPKASSTATAFAPITATEARGNSRAVSAEEFQRLANEGQAKLDAMRANSSAPSGLDEHWDSIKANAYAECQKSWGGVTIDAHTGQPYTSKQEAYALTVKSGQDPVSVHEGASAEQFGSAMDEARSRFDTELSSQGAHLGAFHDDEHNRIDIDPVLVVPTLHDVETIGAATHAIGGAYNYADGNGYWPPHVEGS